MAAMLWLLRGVAADIDGSALWAAAGAVPLTAIIGALGLTAASFLAVAGYDVVAARLLGHALPPRAAMASGFTAVAIGQSVGLSVVVGSAVRWRLLRSFGLSAADAAVMSGVVAAAFLFCLLGAVSALVLLTPVSLIAEQWIEPAQLHLAAAFGLALAIWFCLACWWQPHLVIGRFRPRFPRFRAMLRFMVLCLADVVPAGLALWILLPDVNAPGIGEFLAVYLVALGIALLSNTPGGIGVLEMAMLLAFPDVPAESMLASILLYRAIYYAMPLLAALAYLASREAGAVTSPHAAPAERRAAQRDPGLLRPGRPGLVPPSVALILAGSARAEAALALAGDKRFLLSPDGRAFLMFAEAGNQLVAVSDPVGPEGSWPALIDRFLATARAAYARPVFYKASPRLAPLLQHRRLAVWQFAEEAVIDLAAFDTAREGFGELRRKLKKARTSGVSITRYAPGTAPMSSLMAVSATWETAKGREMGFSQGRADPRYLAAFPVFVAEVAGRAVAFLSVWQSGDGREWALDVMRLVPGAPDGTMHALVATAAAAARAEGALRFSLCSVAFSGLQGRTRLAERLGALVWTHGAERLGLAGLKRFKSAFRPDWIAVHVAAPRPAVLPLMDIIAIRALVTGAPGDNPACQHAPETSLVEGLAAMLDTTADDAPDSAALPVPALSAIADDAKPALRHRP